jgi:hypothetical protein
MFYNRKYQTMNTESNGSNEEILITRAPLKEIILRPIQWARDKYYPAIPLETPIVDYRTFGERAIDKIKDAWQITKLVVVLTPHLFTIIKGYFMNNWKTTISGVVKAVFSVLTIFGVSTGHITEALITAFLWAGAEIVQSIFIPDKK